MFAVSERGIAMVPMGSQLRRSGCRTPCQVVGLKPLIAMSATRFGVRDDWA